MLKAFECNLKDASWRPTVIHHTTRGKAKYQYWRNIQESYPDVKYTDVTCVTVGSPQTNPEFRRTAISRDVPFAKIGMQVEVGGHKGEIAGKDSSANFSVYFMEGPHAGLVLSCHPNWKIKYFNWDGELIKEF